MTSCKVRRSFSSVLDPGSVSLTSPLRRSTFHAFIPSASHADIHTTMNIYGDAVTADMTEAHGKIVELALNGTERCVTFDNWWTRKESNLQPVD